MNSETGTALKLRVLNLQQARAGRDLQPRDRVRPEPAVQEDLRERVRHAGRRALRRADRRLRMDATIRTTSRRCDWCPTSPPARSRRSSRAAGAGMFGFDIVDGTVQAARPRQDLRDGRIRQVAQLPRQRGLALRQPRHAARHRAPALRRGDQADRRVRLRGSADTTPRGEAQAMDHESVLLDRTPPTSMGARLTDAFAQYGFCTAIRGAEGGGKVENLPTHVFTSDDGDIDAKCPTEIGITDRREFELSNLGLPAALPLQEHRLRGVLRRPDGAEAEEVRSPGSHRQRRHFGPAALHHGDQPVRPLPEGDGARQDRQLHGSQRRRDAGSIAGSRTTSTPTTMPARR